MEPPVYDNHALSALFECNVPAVFLPEPWVVRAWAHTYTNEEDGVEGELFLNTLQQTTLFQEGCWLLLEWYLGLGGAGDEVHYGFGTTEVVDYLEGVVGPSREAYAIWISHMVTTKPQQQPDFPAVSHEAVS